MAKSIRNLLLDNIVATLTGITTANGYNHTLTEKNIFRSAIEVGVLNVWPNCSIDVSDLPVSRLSGDVVDRRMTVTLTMGVGGSLKVLPDSVEGLVADIIKAMNADTTRGGYATEQSEPEILDPSYSQILEGHAYVKVIYGIDYRTNRLNPAAA